MAFPFLDDGDITVTVDDVEQVLDTDYTLTGAGVIDAFGVRTNGTVTFLAAPDDQAVVYIERNTSRLQNTALRSSGQFLPATHEEMFDRSMMIHQEDDRRLAVLESLGDLVTVSELADGVEVSTAEINILDPVESTFPFTVACAGGSGAQLAIWRVRTGNNPPDPFDEPPVVDWYPGPGANEVTINRISGLSPDVGSFFVDGLVFF